MGNMEWEEQKAYAYWLARVPGLGNGTKKRLEEYAGSARLVYEMRRGDLKEILTEAKIERLMKAKEKEGIWERYEELKRRGIGFYSICQPGYPEKLKNIRDAPYAVYAEGRLPEDTRPAVAVIGARQCSEYGRFMAERCGRELALEGVNVISGMARGIDGISQWAALKAGGTSYGVLGCGTNICYPPENHQLYEALKSRGGILSELPPDTAPRPEFFPMRNRLISGLADLVLIIEARNKSGTLITADLALEQGKEVYVVPGRVTDPLSQGCNRLLGQGAGLMGSIRAMLEETGLSARAAGADDREEDTGRRSYGSDGEEERVLHALDFCPKSLENIQRETGMEYGRMMFVLMKLCLDGKAEQVSAGQFVMKTEDGCRYE